MIEYVVEVVKRLALGVALRERPQGAIGRVEGIGKASEQFGHGQVHFVIAEVDGRIKAGDVSVIRDRDVSVPEIAVHEGRPGTVIKEQRGSSVDDLLSELRQFATEFRPGGKFELWFEPLESKEP